MISCAHCGYQVEDTVTVCPNCGQPPVASPKKSGNKPWIIALAVGCGCLALVALFGIVAAILVPNLNDAMVRAKQKRTIADMRNLGTAWMSWLTDQVGGSGPLPSGLPEHPTAEELEAVLSPTYILKVPKTDGWGHPFELWINSDLMQTPTMLIRSPGRDGVFEEGDPFEEVQFPIGDYDRDLVWVDGIFVRYPQSAF